MPSVADQLKSARESQNLDIHQVAEMTKIKTEHIRALENGTYDSFSAPVYIRGFVKTYATILKLNVPGILNDLNAELAQTEKFRELPNLAPETSSVVDLIILQLSKVNWKLVGVIAIVPVIFGLLLWFINSQQNKTSSEPAIKLGPGLYRPATNNSSHTLPLPKR